MRQIIIDGNYTADDWGLLMTEKKVDPPAPKTSYLSVPGRDGDLDFTEAVSGRVNYEQRAARFAFFISDGTPAERMALFDEIAGLIHGKSCQIVDSDDHPGYYMTGRLVMSDQVHQMAYSTFVIEGSLYPWRLSSTEKTFTRSGTGSVTIENNGQASVSPTITTTSAATFTYGGKTYSVTAAGTYTNLGIRIATGSSALNATTNTGTITVKFREAVF